jgi:hypothetical protein
MLIDVGEARTGVKLLLGFMSPHAGYQLVLSIRSAAGSSLEASRNLNRLNTAYQRWQQHATMPSSISTIKTEASTTTGTSTPSAPDQWAQRTSQEHPVR